MQRLFKTVLFAGLAFAASAPALAHELQRPWIVAHRGGAADAPENTLLAISSALSNRADAVWLTVQLSSDAVPVLYRPQDLSANTPGRGPVSALTAEQLTQLNAGWNFATPGSNPPSYPYRDKPTPIPTLEQALKAIPANIPVILDLKSLPAPPLVQAVAKLIEQRQEWNRTLFYSTDAPFNVAWQDYPKARSFESRDASRQRLLTVALEQRCDQAPAAKTWTAFEWRRRLDVTETFTLGVGLSPIPAATLWTPQAVACFRSAHRDVRILFIGVDTQADYQQAVARGANAVLVNSPAAAQTWKATP
ncbi:glycerophosphodiester phosphodiesterase family protein [Pseudomonas sp. CGJS7]|uniref:glycerophosphodiester phosphodiesterase family protein n=1 Tax=Pseudomonas sp. CGJS7 TaxID=3109348 RepID=UPI00300BB8A6